MRGDFVLSFSKFVSFLGGRATFFLVATVSAGKNAQLYSTKVALPFKYTTPTATGKEALFRANYSTTTYVDIEIKMLNDRGHDNVSSPANISLYYVDFSVRNLGDITAQREPQ